MPATRFAHAKEWYQMAYVMLGPRRSVDKLYAKLPSPCSGEKHPSRETLRDWCKHGKWRELATSYDEALAQETLTTHTLINGQMSLEIRVLMEKMICSGLMKATQVLGSLDVGENLTVDNAMQLMNTSMRAMDMHMRYMKFQKELKRETAIQEKKISSEENQMLAQADLERIFQMKLTQAKRTALSGRE